MTTFPGSPLLMKGALIAIDSSGMPCKSVVFQYNPDTLSRTLQPQITGSDSNKLEEMRIKGAPIETIKLEIEIDATDRLENAEGSAVTAGIYPQLSALELFVYPNSGDVLANSVLLAAGSIEIVPPLAPLIVFVWGPNRVLPVQITEFSITEESYDVNLNPIRAKVSLGLRVLSYNDLPAGHPGYSIFMAHQIGKEVMAKAGIVGNIPDFRGGFSKTF